MGRKTVSKLHTDLLLNAPLFKTLTFVSEVKNSDGSFKFVERPQSVATHAMINKTEVWALMPELGKSPVAFADRANKVVQYVNAVTANRVIPDSRGKLLSTKAIRSVWFYCLLK